jgi:hypothetical protein
MKSQHDNIVRLIIVGIPMLIVLLPWLVMMAQTGPELGNGLARKMIDRAVAGNGTADVSDFADKTCLAPEGGPPTTEVDRLFPGFKLTFKESEASEGVWFLMLGSNERKTVRILAVQQVVLSWPVSDDANPSELIRCPRTVSISFDEQPPRVTP